MKHAYGYAVGLDTPAGAGSLKMGDKIRGHVDGVADLDVVVV